MRKGFITNRLRSNKKLVDIPIENKIETIQGEKFVWIDLQNPDRNDIEKLAQKYNFNALNIEDCMTKFELPKLDSYDDHFFVILHFPPLAQKIGISKNSQLSIFVGKDFLVTVHQGDLKPLVELVGICKTTIDQQRKDRLLGKSSGLLLHEILDVLVDDLLHISRKIIDTIYLDLCKVLEIELDENYTEARIHKINQFQYNNHKMSRNEKDPIFDLTWMLKFDNYENDGDGRDINEFREKLSTDLDQLMISYQVQKRLLELCNIDRTTNKKKSKKKSSKRRELA